MSHNRPIFHLVNQVILHFVNQAIFNFEDTFFFHLMEKFNTKRRQFSVLIFSCPSFGNIVNFNFPFSQRLWCLFLHEIQNERDEGSHFCGKTIVPSNYSAILLLSNPFDYYNIIIDFWQLKKKIRYWTFEEQSHHVDFILSYTVGVTV